MGIGTDLTVLDERYLFAGAKFLVYLVSSVPTVVLLVLALVIPGYLLYRLMYLLYWGLFCIVPDAMTRLQGRLSRWGQTLWAWWQVPRRLALVGIVLAVVLIQFVMRQCFSFSHLLLTPRLPEPAWLGAFLLAEDDGPMALYFAGLVAGTAVSCCLCCLAWRGDGSTTLSRLMVWLLAFLAAVQILMLPVSYGILIVDKTMPRVATLGGYKALSKGQQAWLIWEGIEGVTYLIRDKSEGQDMRMLVTLPRDEIKQIEIIAYDPILRILFLKE
jgi:hypothetical protein